MTAVHRADPQAEDLGVSACRHCGAHVTRVPGGSGPTWVHTDTGAVAARGAKREDGGTVEVAEGVGDR